MSKFTFFRSMKRTTKTSSGFYNVPGIGAETILAYGG